MSSFSENIQKWLTLDAHQKSLNDKLKEIRNQKLAIHEIVRIEAENNNLVNVPIKTSSGNIKFVNTNVSNPLTFRFVESSLREIIRNDTQVTQIMDYLKKSREVKVVKEIKLV